MDHPGGDRGICDEYALQGKTVRIATRMPELAATLDDVAVTARHRVTVLLTGETGCGKSTLARLIHELSPVHDEPFLPLACGALQATLVESELFGHVKGSFTGADRDKVGKFAVAGQGTLLLDEIDVLPLDMQVKLLRIIETGEFEPVGSNQTCHAEARLIVASNVCLDTLIADNQFRGDLYYRLNVLKFYLPALRERPHDIVPLAMEGIEQASRNHGIAIRRIHPDFFDRLLAYTWPGNIRELKNCMERAVLLCRDGILSPTVLNATTAQPDCRIIPMKPLAKTRLLGEKVASSEQSIIEETLARHSHRRSEAAKELGISRVTLYNKMKKYGLLVPRKRSSLHASQQLASSEESPDVAPTLGAVG